MYMLNHNNIRYNRSSVKGRKGRDQFRMWASRKVSQVESLACSSGFSTEFGGEAHRSIGLGVSGARKRSLVAEEEGGGCSQGNETRRVG